MENFGLRPEKRSNDAMEIYESLERPVGLKEKRDKFFVEMRKKRLKKKFKEKRLRAAGLPVPASPGVGGRRRLMVTNENLQKLVSRVNQQAEDLQEMSTNGPTYDFRAASNLLPLLKSDLVKLCETSEHVFRDTIENMATYQYIDKISQILKVCEDLEVISMLAWQLGTLALTEEDNILVFFEQCNSAQNLLKSAIERGLGQAKQLEPLFNVCYAVGNIFCGSEKIKEFLASDTYTTFKSIIIDVLNTKRKNIRLRDPHTHEIISMMNRLSSEEILGFSPTEDKEIVFLLDEVLKSASEKDCSAGECLSLLKKCFECLKEDSIDFRALLNYLGESGTLKVIFEYLSSQDENLQQLALGVFCEALKTEEKFLEKSIYGIEGFVDNVSRLFLKSRYNSNTKKEALSLFCNLFAMKDLSNEIFADMELVEDIIQYVSTATKGFFGRARREYSEICQVEIDDANLKWDHSATKDIVADGTIAIRNMFMKVDNQLLINYINGREQAFFDILADILNAAGSPKTKFHVLEIIYVMLTDLGPHLQTEQEGPDWDPDAGYRYILNCILDSEAMSRELEVILSNYDENSKDEDEKNVLELVNNLYNSYGEAANGDIHNL